VTPRSAAGVAALAAAGILATAGGSAQTPAPGSADATTALFDALEGNDPKHKGIGMKTNVPADAVQAFLAALTWYGKVMKSDEIIALLAGEMVK
jgi:hypothetical protein